MIDVKLIKEARPCSEALKNSDVSWREYLHTCVENLKKNVLNLPFSGNLTVLLRDKLLLIEGYCGELRIDRLYSRNTTYILKQPVKFEGFRVYGVYDRSANFRHFTSEPVIGFHYLGLSGENIRPICTGDLKCGEPKSLDELKREAARIMNAFRIINMESLGDVVLPDDAAGFKEIMANKEVPSEAKVQQLLERKLIEKLL